MLKHVLLAGGMMIALPALAQTSPATGQTQSGTTQTQPGRVQTPSTAQSTPAPSTSATPQTSAPAPTTSPAPTGDAITAQTSPATPAPTAPADPVVGEGTTEPATPAAAAPAPQAAQAAPAPAQATPAPAQTAAADTGGSQVQQIVGREFGAYDKNKDGKLSQGEFDAWMVALKTASDPATKADSPETKQWLGAAFAQADADKSRDVTQAELTGFLSQGQS